MSMGMNRVDRPYESLVDEELAFRETDNGDWQVDHRASAHENLLLIGEKMGMAIGASLGFPLLAPAALGALVIGTPFMAKDLVDAAMHGIFAGLEGLGDSE